MKNIIVVLWLAGALAAVAQNAALEHTGATAGATGWDSEPAILARIKAPQFPARDFPITDFGAKGDGTTDCTEAIARAIAACHAAGGGRVVVAGGVFLTGSVHLLGNVNLHIAEGATLQFASDRAKFLPVVFTRFEGTECMNYSPLIYAFEQENIAVTGSGTLNGSGAQTWWGFKKRGAAAAPKNLLTRRIAACRWRNALSAKAADCGQTSSSRTAAAMFSLRMFTSPIPPCGKSTRFSPPMSRCAASGFPATGRTTTAAIPNAPAMCSSKIASSTPATTASPSSPARMPTAAASMFLRKTSSCAAAR